MVKGVYGTVIVSELIRHNNTHIHVIKYSRKGQNWGLFRLALRGKLSSDSYSFLLRISTVFGSIQ